MCGIAGYIGESKNPNLTYRLATRLFERIESRGTDASGFYGSEGDTIHHHKQTLRSAHYVKTEPWRNLGGKNCNMLIAHARGASVGDPQDNRNSHPFLNKEKTLALVHNGTLTTAEYKNLLKRYEVESACDSEILMRIIIGSDAAAAAVKYPDEKPDVAARLLGLKDLFSVINHGHMAAAVAENTPGEKRLWLFRNEHRPLWVADVRDSLGQVFFCSTPEIWTSAVNATHDLRRLPGFSKHKLYNLTPQEVWMFTLADDLQYRRFSVSQDTPVPWKHDGTKVALDCKPTPTSELAVVLANLRESLDFIEQACGDIEQENSLTPQGYSELVNGLGMVDQDLLAVRQGLEKR